MSRHLKKAWANSKKSEILQELLIYVHVLLYLQKTNIHGEVSDICSLDFAQTWAKRKWTGKHPKNWDHRVLDITLSEMCSLFRTTAQRRETLSYAGWTPNLQICRNLDPANTCALACLNLSTGSTAKISPPAPLGLRWQQSFAELGTLAACAF